MVRLIIIAGLTLGLGFSSYSQNVQVKRSVICSFGATNSNSNGYICATLGQPPNAGTIRNSTVILRQGFQQPKGENCGLLASFSVDSQNDGCGTNYFFEYTGNLPGTFNITWDFGDNAVPSTSNEALPPQVTYTTKGIKLITLTIEVGGCAEMVSKFIDVTELGFGANANVSDANCNGGNDGAIEVITFGGVPPVEFFWSNGASTENLSDLVAGDYTITIADNSGCQFTNTYTIVEPDTIGAVATIKEETCTGRIDGGVNIEASGGSGIYFYNWSDGSTSKDLFNVASGVYFLTITDSAGCTNEYGYNVGLICDNEFVEFNTITPNGDGMNDFWVINGIDQFPNNIVQVLNRWGVVVFEKKAYANDWAGTNSSGRILPSGGYFYIVRLGDPDNTVYSGSLTIVR